jgi:AcrR family transcriptional regulator
MKENQEIAGTTTPSVMGRPRDHEATALVLKTTFDLLDEDSFAHLTVQKIADRSGVAKTTIYRRWPNVASIVMDAFLSEIRTGNTNRVNNLTWAKKIHGSGQYLI